MKPRLRLILKNIDWIFLLLIAVLLTYSMFILKSASSNVTSAEPLYHFIRQFMWIVVGFFAMVITAFIDYKHYKKFLWIMYGVCILLLAGIMFMPEIENTHRWIDLGFMNFQPSELAKISIIVSFSSFLAINRERIKTFGIIAISIIYILLPMGLILIEPDLGTSLVLLAIAIPILWVAGASKKFMMAVLILLIIIIVAIFGVLYAATDGYSHKLTDSDIPEFIPLQAYQLNRLIIFINPYMDPLDAGYHMIQSEVAIGSGGLYGKGYGQGTQVQGNFLPAHHTDFIFSVAGEELGFIGTSALLAIYLLVILRGVWIAFRAKDLHGSLIAIGVVSMFSFQIVINIGMTIGIMPITGLPLPFLSYGGSSMLFNMIALGLVMSVAMHKEEPSFFGGVIG